MKIDEYLNVNIENPTKIHKCSIKLEVVDYQTSGKNCICNFTCHIRSVHQCLPLSWKSFLKFVRILHFIDSLYLLFLPLFLYLQETLGPNSGNVPRAEHRGSRGSLTSTQGDVCRICHCESEHGIPLISPCVCAGSLKYVHQACLQQWIKSANTKSCELCKYNFQMTSKIKPFRKVSIFYDL